MVEVGSYLWRSSCLTPLFRQGHLNTVVQDHDRQLLNNSKVEDSTSSLVNLCHCLVTLMVKVFPNVQVESSVFQFV